MNEFRNVESSEEAESLILDQLKPQEEPVIGQTGGKGAKAAEKPKKEPPAA